LKDEDIKKAVKIFKNSKVFDGQLFLSVKNAGKEIKRILEVARKNKINVIEVNIRKPTLNDVFLSLTGKEIREETVNLKDMLRNRMPGH
jgi:ABC-2 type transport system ATP-binding protein